LLGGEVVTEMDAQANKTKGYIYAQGVKLVEQTILYGSSYLSWRQTNPGTGNWILTPSGGGYVQEKKEHDPLGAEVGTTNPYLTDPIPTYPDMGQPLYIEGGDPFDRSGGYEIDGLPVSASEFLRRAGAGSLQTQTIFGKGDVLYLGGDSLAYYKAVGRKTDGPSFSFDTYSIQSKQTKKQKSKIVWVDVKSSKPDPIRETAEAAILLLLENQKCREALGVSKDDALNLLQSLYKNNRIKSKNFEDDDILGFADGTGEKSTIYLSTRNFINPMTATRVQELEGKDSKPAVAFYDLADSRIFMMLHELGHATGRYIHPDFRPDFLVKWLSGAKEVISTGRLNRIIHENCLKDRAKKRSGETK
jgi:hypothetical protein